MKKQFLSVVALTVLPLALSVTAAPTDESGSTEQADRQFLQKLEQADAAQAARSADAPAPAKAPSPATAGPGQADARPATAQSAAVVRRPRTIVLADDYDQAAQLEEVAANEPNIEQRPAPVTHVTIVRPARASHAERHRSERRPLHRFFSRLLNFHPEDW